jgi:hypothetical protein
MQDWLQPVTPLLLCEYPCNLQFSNELNRVEKIVSFVLTFSSYACIFPRCLCVKAEKLLLRNFV